jgi:ABC-2 type transport system ATP-binding protein
MTSAVSIKNLVKDYQGLKAVNGLNLDVPEGSIYGFLGPNGAGKTTTLKMLVGMTEPTSGEIKIFGQPVTFGSIRHRDDIGFLPDVPGFYDWMTPVSYLDFCGKLYQMEATLLKKRIKETLEMVSLIKVANKKIGGFSRGMKQRLGIAQALIHDPKIIMLDEPVSALDPQGRKDVIDIIAKLAGKVTVFFSTHILADVERICDRVVIIHQGKAVLEGPIENIRKMGQANRLEIEFQESINHQLIEEIQKTNWLEKAEINDKKIALTVNDIVDARLELNQLFNQYQVLINKFAVAEPTLEDIFLKVVNGDA